MIPSTNSKLLVAEDWKKVYQSFKNSDFKSYDFETLRRTMISYLREKYPEDFNDYIESSEFVALIDLIAYLGQNLSFRVDLNARENFLETAQRRDSILRLAQLINYNASRNIPANGLLKLTAVTTTDNVFDANGSNLANSIIAWNDSSNLNWYQQFITVLNSAMPGSVTFGKPYSKKIIGSIPTEQYKLNSANSDVPIFSFSKIIGGISMPFEITSCEFTGKEYIYESVPKPADQFSLLFRNDSKGSSSANTGFFAHFRQGTLNLTSFSIDAPVPNEIVGINASNINDSDVWLWQIDASGNYSTNWIKVNNVVGNNVIYNSLTNDQRNIFAVTTREDDQIDLNFADGLFGNLPKGNFVFFYRQSNGLKYSIKPEQINGVQIQVPYFNKSGQRQLLTMTFSLQYTISNSESSESDANVKLKAPQSFYTQNRMITGEDYNIAPLTAGADIVKVKTVNRIASGVSKYFELSDVSGKYSSTNIFGSDGALYRDDTILTFDFTYTNKNEIYAAIINQMTPVAESTSMRNFYFNNWARPQLLDPGVYWQQVTKSTNQTTGYFKDSLDIPLQTGVFSSNNLAYVRPDSLIKFVPPLGNYFLSNGKLTTIQDSTTQDVLWVKASLVIGDGAYGGLGTLPDGTGPVILTQYVPTGALAKEIIPAFDTVFSYTLQTDVVNLCLAKRNFGLSFSLDTRQWYIINDTNLNLNGNFSIVYQKDITNSNKDASWLFAFQWTGLGYQVRYRATDYIFESENETAFYFDNTSKNFDFVKNTVIKDQITVLSTNPSPTNYYGNAMLSLNVNANGSVVSFNIENRGSGFVSTPTITATLGTSPTNSFIAKLSNGSISDIIVVNSGTGYASTSTVIVDSSDAAYSTLPLGKDYGWQIDGNIVESDGYIEPKKIKISFLDQNDDGQIENPDAFDDIVAPDSVSYQTNKRDKFVFFERSSDGLTYSIIDGSNIKSYPSEDNVPDEDKNEGQMFYFYDESFNVIKSYSSATTDFYTLEPTYFAKPGRRGISFHYKHNSGEDRRLDPSKTNLMDIFVLTKGYDVDYRNWIVSPVGAEPVPPTTSALEENYASSLEQIKSISDELVYQPVKYKVLFGTKASKNLQATFKAVRNSTRSTTENELKTKILSAIENFFALENWEFGQTFYFSELATYIMNSLTPDITNFIIVPKTDIPFGSLYEIACQNNEIFINGATINDIEIIDAITANQIKTTDNIVNSTSVGVY
jgi:hypothetical protein